MFIICETGVLFCCELKRWSCMPNIVSMTDTYRLVQIYFIHPLKAQQRKFQQRLHHVQNPIFFFIINALVCTWQICRAGEVSAVGPVIGGSDLLVHNRGKNTDLDEWLKDAVEVILSLSLLYLCVNSLSFVFMIWAFVWFRRSVTTNGMRVLEMTSLGEKLDLFL